MRQHRQPGDRHAGRARRAARGGTVELPAALGAVAAARRGRGAQRRRGPPRLARLDGRLCGRQGAGAGRQGRGRRRSTIRSPPGCWPAPPHRFGSDSRLGEPAAGELGVRDGVLVDRAFADGLVLAETASIPVPGPIGVLNALAAAALARAVDVPAAAIADALSSFRVGPHRAERGRRRRRRHLRRRLQGHQPARGARVDLPPTRGWCGSPAVCSRARRSTKWSPSVSNRLVGAVLIGRDRARGRQRVIATRPRCPRRGGCDRGGCCGA